MSTTDKPVQPPIGLALAGGAAQGAIYEIGALRALDEVIEGVELHELGVYVGVSAGGFLASCLANGLTTDQMVRAIVKSEPGEHPFVPEIFFQPAMGEIARRLGRAPGLLGSALLDWATRREGRLVDALTRLGTALPVGIFAGEPIREYVSKIFEKEGRTDDFRKLNRKLVVVSTDLESGEAAPFGTAGLDHIPISKAVQATTALPGLYLPVEIEGRAYVDGILLKTMHASVALDAGAELVFCINPVVPVDTRPAVLSQELEENPVLRQGLPSVLSQTVRTMIHSRMSMGIRAYDARYPDADVLLVEPRRDDHEVFFSNIFSFGSRRTVCERAYHATRRLLWERREEIAPILERHGLRLAVEELEDVERDLWAQVTAPEQPLSPWNPEGKESGEHLLSDLDALLDRVERLAQQQAAR